jgi:hypothetical protein
MRIDGVPESVTREQVAEWLGWLGVDADDVPLDSAVRLGRSCISVEVYARDPDGKRMILGDDVARHTIAVPLVAPPRYPKPPADPPWPRFSLLRKARK